ncbi:hypothetical protein [Catellatospora sp. NPDC049609]|uniref:hypothetical protein n=1 Tax=Catellatospora sp. NPDC049609 TaxID=3155505 RepID=UPI0034249881
MSFEVSLRGPTNAPSLAEGPSAADYDSVVMDACVILASTDCAFRVGGFGSAGWPVDVGCDLSTFVEQLPEAIDAIRDRRNAEIDFYGQGIERTLLFEVEDPLVRIKCLTRTSWKPDPEIEVVARDKIILMLMDVSSEFASALKTIWPDVDSVRPICEMLISGRWDPSFLSEG